MRKTSRQNIKKQQEGITLIALVITIIVMLILAGISIAMLAGDNGVLTRAGDAKKKSDKATLIENARIELLGKNVNNSGRQIKESQLIEVLKKYFNEDEVDEIEIPEDVSTSNAELTSKQGNYKIKLSEIYEGKITPTWVYNHSKQTVKKGTLEFNIGDKIDYTAPAGSGYEGDWQVLGVGEGDEEGQLLLVSEEFVNNGNTKTIQANDYATPGGDPLKDLQRAVDDLDALCTVYKNENATKGRSIRVEDVNRLTGYDPQNAYLSDSDITQRGNSKSGTIGEYGNTVKFKIESRGAYVGYKYGYMADYSTTGNSTYTSYIPWGASSSLEVGVESLPVKLNYYTYFLNTLGVTSTCEYEEPGLRSTSVIGYENSYKAYSMIKLNNHYWLASPHVGALDGCTIWGMRYVRSEGCVWGYILWNTGRGAASASARVRAVVSLKSDVIPVLKTST